MQEICQDTYFNPRKIVYKIRQGCLVKNEGCLVKNALIVLEKYNQSSLNFHTSLKQTIQQ